MASPRDTKMYKLMRGEHRIPNPSYDPTLHQPDESHVTIEAGENVALTDDQFRAFSDKFVPAESAASSVRDEDDQRFEQAKMIAKANPGQPINPNTLPKGGAPQAATISKQ